MSTERHAQDYEERLAAAGGADPLAVLAASVKRGRRVQVATVIGLILLLGISAVLTVTIINVNETTNRAEVNKSRSQKNTKQANDIVRCLTTAKDPGRCLGRTVRDGTPGSRGLRGQTGAPGLPGPRGRRGRTGPRGPAPTRFTCGPPAANGTMSCTSPSP